MTTPSGPADHPPRPTSAGADDAGPGGTAPRLRTGTTVLWRASDVVQLELGSRAVVIDGVGPALAAVLAGQPAPSRTAGAVSNPTVPGEGELSDVLGQLERAGFLTDVIEPRPLPGRLSPDALALSMRLGPRAPAVLEHRRDATVLVQGTGRLPTMIAALLAAAGLGAVHCSLAGPEDTLFGLGGRPDPVARRNAERGVAVAEAAPGGLLPSDEGRRPSLAAAEAVRRAAPGVRTGVLAAQDTPDLVVLAGLSVDTVLRQNLHRWALPHLLVAVSASTATIGPLVVPGRTSCLACADLHRRDRDPAWPALAAQLTSMSGRRPRAEDVTACALACALGVVQALAFLDGEPEDGPATVDGTLEITAPDWRIRRRSWPLHPLCVCGTITATPTPTPHHRHHRDGRLGE